jgi:hypothetical protein
VSARRHRSGRGLRGLQPDRGADERARLPLRPARQDRQLGARTPASCSSRTSASRSATPSARSAGASSSR